MEINKNIDFIFINQLLPGELKLEELIEEIHEINEKIKIIIFLDNYKNGIEKSLIKKDVYRIFYNNEIEIMDIIKIINEDDKMEKYNLEIKKEIEELKNYINKNNSKKIINKKINNKKNKIKKCKNNILIIKAIKIKKIIIKYLNKYSKINFLNSKNIYDNLCEILENKKIFSILGNNGAGKSIFTVLLSISLKKNNKKILIIDFDIFNNNIHTIFGVKKYPDLIKEKIYRKNINFNKLNISDLIIKINNKIDLISGINILNDNANKISFNKLKYNIEKIINNYDYIIFDTPSDYGFDNLEEILKISDLFVFISEPNLVGVSKSKNKINYYYKKYNIEKNKINIIFNKNNKNSIDVNILKNIFSENKILGKIKENNFIDIYINKNLKIIK